MNKFDHDLNTFFALIFHEISLSALGIQIRKSKIYLNEVALRIGCRNMFWSQCFNQKLISPSGWIVVLAALDTFNLEIK